MALQPGDQAPDIVLPDADGTMRRSSDLSGKILVLFWVIRVGDNFLLSFPLDLLDSIKARLQMFVLMADVMITDVPEQYLQIGVIGKPQIDSLSEGYTRFNINEQLRFILSDPKNLSKFNFVSQEYWDKACVENFIPEINSITTEKFIPQMLNLDIDEIGVNFTKGCYPGQEVVARLHYLGKAKRRMYKFKGGDIPVGEELIVEDSKSLRASGTVIRGAKSGNEYFYLASIETDHKDDKITSHNGISLVRIKDV